MSKKSQMSNQQRACQVWAVLAYAASKKQILTYVELARLTGLAQNGMTDILLMVQAHCTRQKRPNLTSLVVSENLTTPEKNGLPLKGCDLPKEDKEWAQAQFRAMSHQWGRNPGVYAF